MKKKFLAVILTLALLITALPADSALFGILAPLVTSAGAVDAVGEDGEAFISFASSDFTSQFFPDGNEYASTCTSAKITGAGTYTVSVSAVSVTEDDVQALGATGLLYANIMVVNGETLFPGMAIKIDSVKFDGLEAALTGTPYTHSFDGSTTITELCNPWAANIPADARTAIDGSLADDATATALSLDSSTYWVTMEIDFTVSLASSVEKIGDYYQATDDKSVAIVGYTGTATTLAIPSTIAGKPVSSIGEAAFYDCNSLTSITIPDSITKIDENAFAGCPNLATITVNSGNSNFSSDSGMLYNKAKTKLVTCPEGKSGSITIPDSVTSIGNYAFLNCLKITSVSIPASVESIGKCAFVSCSALAGFTVNSENTYFLSLNGVLYNKNKTELLYWPCGKTTIAIPSTVAAIGDWAFAGNSKITSMTIPSNVKSVGKYSFAACENLESVTVSNGLTEIGEWAFSFCFSLAAVTIPVSVSEIGEYTFYFCSSDLKIYAYRETYAELYANDLGIPYVCLNPKSISSCTVKLSAASYTYDGSAKKPTVTVKDGTKTLVLNTDYTVAYANNTKAGTATVTITGKGNYSGTLKKTFTIKAKAISSCTATLSATSYTYNGSAKKPTVIVKDGTKKLVLNTDYTVAYANNTKVGTATVTITGKGNYSGTLKKTFTIKLGTTTAKVTAGTKKATISWSKVTGASGYQIYMATSKTGTYTLIKSTTLLSYTKTGLTTGKTYYFKVRAYTTVNGKKVYGAYSTIVYKAAK